jgi:hypothetical protein
LKNKKASRAVNLPFANYGGLKMNILRFIVFDEENKTRWGSAAELQQFYKICKFLKQNIKGVNNFTVAWFDEKEIYKQNFVDFCKIHKI